MFSKLFHKDVYMPERVVNDSIALQKDMVSIEFSRHFEQHCLNYGDRSHDYGNEVKDRVLSLKQCPVKPFEVEYGKSYRYFKARGWFVNKFVVRFPFNSKQDISVVFFPKWKEGKPNVLVVGTAWLNSHEDMHFTLDASKYCSEDEWIETLLDD